MNLNCDNVRDFVSMYMDGAVSVRTRNDIKAHLGQCGACRRFYHDYRSIIDSKKSIREEFGFTKNFSDIAKRMKKKEQIRLTAFLSSFISAVAATVILTKSIFLKDTAKN